MSETQNTPEPEFNMSDVRGKEIDVNAEPDDKGAAELEEARLMLPQTEVILPVIMPKGDKIMALGDAVFDPDTNKMVVSFNTVAGRDIAEFIGTGMLAAISFVGHMPKRNANSN